MFKAETNDTTWEGTVFDATVAFVVVYFTLDCGRVLNTLFFPSKNLGTTGGRGVGGVGGTGDGGQYESVKTRSVRATSKSRFLKFNPSASTFTKFELELIKSSLPALLMTHTKLVIFHEIIHFTHQNFQVFTRSSL